MPDAAGSRLVSGHPPTAPASRPPLPQSSAWAKASAVVIRPAPGGPTNAYACATRSVASARRSSATARGWSRIASSATQELLDARAHRRGDHVRGLPRAHEAHALGLRAQDLEVAPTHAPMEGERLALEAVAPPAAHPPEPLGGIDVEQQGEVRQDTAGRPDVQLADQVGVDAAPVALIRHGRVGVAVGEHHAAALEPRADPPRTAVCHARAGPRPYRRGARAGGDSSFVAASAGGTRASVAGADAWPVPRRTRTPLE